MTSYHPKIVSEELHTSNSTAVCGPCGNRRRKVKASTNVRVGFTMMRGEDSFGDFCVSCRKALGQLISSRNDLADWPSHFSGEFWKDT
jgi:hypothetical protein